MKLDNVSKIRATYDGGTMKELMKKFYTDSVKFIVRMVGAAIPLIEFCSTDLMIKQYLLCVLLDPARKLGKCIHIPPEANH